MVQGGPSVPEAEGSMDPSSQEAILASLGQILVQLGCPADRSQAMAMQLDKRARQLAASKSKPYQEALAHLLGLMKQGWAAKDKGL